MGEAPPGQAQVQGGADVVQDLAHGTNSSPAGRWASLGAGSKTSSMLAVPSRSSINMLSDPDDPISRTGSMIGMSSAILAAQRARCSDGVGVLNRPSYGPIGHSET